MRKTILGYLANEIMFDDETNVEILERKWHADHRWYTDFRVVFKFREELGFYALVVAVPNSQDNEYELFGSMDEVSVQLVRPKVVQTVEYEDVTDEEM